MENQKDSELSELEELVLMMIFASPVSIPIIILMIIKPLIDWIF